MRWLLTLVAALSVDVYHLASTPVQFQNVSLFWSPQTFTLVHSATEAVLVDAPIVAENGTDLANWISKTAPGKTLKYVYITHAHGDHFNSFPQILAKFPGAQVVATKGVIDHLPTQYEPPTWDGLWQALFPDVQQANLSLVKPLSSSADFFINGKSNKKFEFRAILVGEGDTTHSTVMYVPSIDLVVGGDVVYGHCYQWLVENLTPQLRSQWIASLDQVKALRPKVVVPSHTQEQEGFGPQHLQETQDYIRGWGELLAKAKKWQELEALAKARWPDRIGSVVLRDSAEAFFGAAA
ncbi:Metallo-hydrolase/oxidoreductase [Periconia macrospinosa]|uniref:Metallo-hydrolase/oxidoreductase n=1 Tax=Periconia macrospinosa TaxID=97972 RepID=A0A2V1DR39_9PLEO|nr:Metallo-hydrolase/oxidoreductase [Periconia macrospinosa]